MTEENLEGLLNEEGNIEYHILEYRAIMNPKEVRSKVLIEIAGMIYEANFTTRGLHDEEFDFTPVLERIPSPDRYHEQIRSLNAYEDSYNRYHLIEEGGTRNIVLIEKLLDRKKLKIIRDFTQQREYTQTDYIEDMINHRDIREFFGDMEEDIGMEHLVDGSYRDPEYL